MVKKPACQCRRHKLEFHLGSERSQDEGMATLQTDNMRQIKRSDGNIYLLDRLECPAVLVECGFLSNQEDCTNLNDVSYRKKLALIISLSLIENMY